MRRSLFFAFAMMLLVVSLHACDIFEAENEYPEGKASVRVVHVAPEDTLGIDYFHKEEVIFENLQFGTQTEFVDIPVGRNPDGFLNSDDGDTLIARNEMSGDWFEMRFFDFERNFTVFTLHGPSASGNVHIRSMEIEPTPNADGLARVRVLHAVSALDPVDIYLSDPGDDGIDEDNLFQFDIPFNNEGGSASSTPSEMPLYSNVDPGTYEVKLTLSESTDVEFAEELQIESGRNYTMVLFPNADNDGIDHIMLLADN